jgi:hypothetical protein
MYHESSLPYSQVPATCTYPEPAASSPHLLMIHWHCTIELRYNDYAYGNHRLSLEVLVNQCSSSRIDHNQTREKRLFVHDLAKMTVIDAMSHKAISQIL